MPTITGTAGSDVLMGTTDSDIINGQEGSDVIDGRGGADQLIGGDGDDTFVFTTIRTFGAADSGGSINGGVGNDTLDLSRLGPGTVTLVRSGSGFRLTTGQDSFAVTNVERFIFRSDFSVENVDFGTSGPAIYLDMGGGGDTLSSISDGSTVHGGSGADVLNGAGRGYFFGDAGNDIFVFTNTSTLGFRGTIDGGDGIDTLVLLSGSIDLTAGSYFVGGLSGTLSSIENVRVNLSGSVRGNSAANILTTESLFGSFEFRGEGGDDILSGGANRDGGGDRLYGGDGNDLITGGGGADLIDGGEGVDTFILSAGGTVSLVSGQASVAGVVSNLISIENVTGSNDADTLSGDAGTNRLDGGGGADLIRAGAGDDVIQGGTGDDVIYGEAGADTLDGGTGSNVVYGGDGDDVIVQTIESSFENGADQLYGEAGNDVIRLSRNGTGLTIADGGEGDDVIQMLGSSSASVFGGVGNDLFESRGSGRLTVETGLGSDTIRIYSLATPGVTVTDFTVGAGGDVLSLIPLIAANTAWDGATNPFTAGFFRWVQSGPDALLQYSIGGASGGSYVQVALLRNVQVGQLTATNLGGLDPTGASADATPMTFVGGTGSDVLFGGVGNDILSGRAGDDIIVGGAGADSLYGEAGNDLIRGGAGEDGLDGADGDDVLFGDDGNDSLVGGAGNDTLWGQTGGDGLDGGEGTDTLNGGEGDDYLTGGLGDDTINGGAGTDFAVFNYSRSQATITNNSFGPIIVGGPEGRDTLVGIESLVFTDGAYDVINGIVQSDPRRTLQGGPGDDVLIGGTSADTISGGGGGDQIRGLSGDNVLDGGDGDDTFYLGGPANDTVRGGAGRDRIVIEGSTPVYIDLSQTARFQHNLGSLLVSGVEDVSGGDGNDLILGDAGSNRLEGGAGGDRLYGNAGDDILVGGAGNDEMQGGAGYDIAVYSGPRSAYTLSFSGQTWVVEGPDGRDALSSIEAFQFADGLYEIIAPGQLANSPSVLIPGTPGADALTGTAGNDGIEGGDGDDVIFGSAGFDRIDGGLGRDRYVAAGAGGSFDLRLTGPQRNALGSVTLVSIEDLTGGTGGDFIVGSAGSNRLDGGSGNDTINGFEGNDELTGGSGNDVLDGGAGFDTAVFGGTRSAATVTFSDGVFTVVGIDGTDRVSNVEIMNFADGTFDVLGGRLAVQARQTVTGSAAADALRGGESNDVLNGLDGNDVLNGGSGNDVLNGGAGVDTADYAGVRRQYVTSATSVSGNGEGTDTLVSIEQVRFVDGILTFDATSASAQVMRLYSATLNRTPDQGGLEANVGALGRIGLQGVADAFVGSAEFQGRFGALNNQQFVEQLYVFALGRQGDAGGIAGWVNALNTGSSRGQVVIGFSESLENQNRTAATLNAGVWVPDQNALVIARLYDATFDRLPDVAGLTGWVNALNAGTPLIDIAAAFAGSAEFQGRYGALSNQAFVEQLYRFCLNREGDAAGIALQVNALNSGTSRAQLVLAFSESAEHIALTAPLYSGGIRTSDSTFNTAPVEDEVGKALDGQPQVLILADDIAPVVKADEPQVLPGGVAYDPVKIAVGFKLVDDAFVLPPQDELTPLVLAEANVLDTVALEQVPLPSLTGNRMLTLPIDADGTTDDVTPWHGRNETDGWMMH